MLQKSKVAGPRIFREKRNGKQSPIRIDAIALSKSPVSLTLGDAVPHIFTRKSRLRPLEFLILGAKRLLQHNREGADVERDNFMSTRPNQRSNKREENLIERNVNLAKKMIESNTQPATTSAACVSAYSHPPSTKQI